MNLIEKFILLLVEILKGFFNLIVEVFEAIFQASNNNKEYKASFASQGILLSSFNHGFCLTGKKKLTKKDCYQNALIIGGTGTGKTSVVILPTLFTMTESVVIHDPSGELFTKSAGFLKQKGFDVKVLNFANPQVSSGYNPLARAQNSSDIQKVASLLVENALGGKTKDPFWNTQASALLTMLITIVKKLETQFHNLYNVRQLLNTLGSNPEAVDSLFTEYADDALFNEYKSFIAYDEKVVSGVIATCKAALQIFNDEYVAKVTSFDNLDFMDLRMKPTALFIQNSIADQKYYSVLTSLLFEQFFAFLLSRFPQKNEKDIFLLIDEAASLNLPTLPLAVANVRKHRSGIMLLIQDFNQLVHNYGKYDADAIRANCFAKMYFTGCSLETTKELEQTLGKYQYEDEKRGTIVRPLMTNDEIRTMKINRAILVCGHHPPIIAKLRPFYKNSYYRRYSNIEAPEMINERLAMAIPLLMLKAYKKHKEKRHEA